MSEATALRILSREMSDKGDDYRTDAYGIEALCLSDAADLIDKQAAENAKLRAALEEIRDAGPMTLDDQRWRIALDALGGDND